MSDYHKAQRNCISEAEVYFRAICIGFVNINAIAIQSLTGMG